MDNLRRHGNKLAFKKLLPVAQGGDEELRKNARQFTGFSSAEAFVAMWNVLNHDGGASWTKTWHGAQSVRPEAERQRAEHSQPHAIATPWEDIFFYWWFMVKTGVDHSVASFMEISQVSGFLELMEKGDACAADRGFEQLAHLLAEKECYLVYPPKRFRGKKDAEIGQQKTKPFTADEVAETSA